MFFEGCFTTQHFSKSFTQNFLLQLAVGALDQPIKSTNHPITLLIYIWKLPFLKLSAGCFFNGDTKQFFVKINLNLFAKSENSSRLQHCDFRRQNYVFKYYGHQRKIIKPPPHTVWINQLLQDSQWWHICLNYFHWFDFKQTASFGCQHIFHLAEQPIKFKYWHFHI